MKIPTHKSTKLPPWELRTPKWRKEKANAMTGNIDKQLQEQLRKMKPGESVLSMKWISHGILHRTAVQSGTTIITRQVKYQDRDVQRIWLVYPCLSDSQIAGHSQIKDDEAGPCFPGWIAPAGFLSHRTSVRYAEVGKIP
jgi:hypothetical protein